MQVFQLQKNIALTENVNHIKLIQCDGTISMNTHGIMKIHIHFCLKWLMDENWLFWRWTHKIKSPQSVTFVWTLSSLEKSKPIVFTHDQYIVIHHAIIRFQKLLIDPIILNALYGSHLQILKIAQRKHRLKLQKQTKKCCDTRKKKI